MRAALAIKKTVISIGLIMGQSWVDVKPESQWDCVWKYLKIVDPEIRWLMIMFKVYFSSFGHALCFRHTQDRYGSELTSILGWADTENDLRWGSIGAPCLSHSRNNYLLSLYIYKYANIYLTGLIPQRIRTSQLPLSLFKNWMLKLENNLAPFGLQFLLRSRA